MYYAGIGARKTPKDVCEKFEKIAKYLRGEGWTLRSGGADSAFEAGALKKEIYLPWKGFNENESSLFTQSERAREIARKHYDRWDSAKESVRKLMARNVHQVLGPNCDNPSQFVVCWTEGGKRVGGTALALSIADEYRIPIFNFYKDQTNELWKFLNK